MYAELVNQTNMSYSNGVPFAKHASSYMEGRAGSIPSPLHPILLSAGPIYTKV